MATDVSMRRPRRTLTDQEQRRFKALLNKPALQPMEKGELATLGRRGTPAQEEQANAKVSSARTPTVEEAGMEIAKAAGRVLNDQGR